MNRIITGARHPQGSYKLARRTTVPLQAFYHGNLDCCMFLKYVKIKLNVLLNIYFKNRD